MNTTRRHVLKSMLTVAGGVSLPLGFSSAALAEMALPAKSTVVVVSSDQAGQQFLSGIQAQRNVSIAQVLDSSTDLSFIQRLQQVLQTNESQRVVGLVDDASATLIMDLARSANARLLWEGQHAELSGAQASVLGQALVGAATASQTATGRQVGGHHVSFMLEI